MKSQTLLLISITIIYSASAMAEVFYCGTHIIDGNSYQTEVLKYCGEPSSKKTDQWVYERANEPSMLVHFEADGTINRIQELTE